MRSNTLAISSALAALAAVVMLPVSTSAAGIIFVMAGILAIFISDYGRPIKTLGLRAEIVPFNATDCALVRLSDAA
jgi:hypothetical protein